MSASKTTIHQGLLTNLERIRQLLNDRIAQIEGKSLSQMDQKNSKIDPDGSNNDEETPPIDQLCHIFNLSQFEREVILLCVGMEFDPIWPALCATAQVDPQYSFPTFNLAQNIFETVEWEATAPESSLRYWKLIEVGDGQALMLSPLRIDERIFHFLLGTNQIDKRLIGLVKLVFESKDSGTRVSNPGILVASHQQICQQIVSTWRSCSQLSHHPGESGDSEVQEDGSTSCQGSWRKLNLPIIQLYGPETTGKQAIAIQVCQQFKLNLYRISSQVLPTNLNELSQLIQFWRREARLVQAILLLEIEEFNSTDTARESAINHFIGEIDTPLILTGLDRRPQPHRQMLTFEVNKPQAQEQQQIWLETLTARQIDLNGFVDQLVAQFNLSVNEIQAVSQQISAPLPPNLSGEMAENPLNQPQITQQIWQICRTQAQPQLNELAQPIPAMADWDDLVLPDLQKQTLQSIASHVKYRMTVYEQWGFVQKGKRGLGITALFAGTSGTGKTMAAEVLAQELRLDLYRIDLSSVVSKYIGETEKNLRQVFDKAETGGAILLFDEADALFGKRSEVKDSRDRYANLEVSYLLQRMEAYRGLAILTTNLKEAIDNAFLRRIRFVVKFPLPDATQRAEIWRRVFPKHTPTEGLDFRKLARLNVPGGNIRNIALNAAFLAADAGESVRMTHLLQAAESEYAKLERPLTDAEIRGWV